MSKRRCSVVYCITFDEGGNKEEVGRDDSGAKVIVGLVEIWRSIGDCGRDTSSSCVLITPYTLLLLVVSRRVGEKAFVIVDKYDMFLRISSGLCTSSSPWSGSLSG